MNIFKRILSALTNRAASLEEKIDAKKLKRRHRKGFKKKIKIEPYNGLGNEALVLLKGRVMQKRNIRSAEDSRNAFQNFRGMLQRMVTNEIPFIEVTATVDGKKITAETDEEGYFNFQLPAPSDSGSDTLWYDIQLEISDERIPKHLREPAVGTVQIPSPKCDTGIISDIDDTVLQTNATSLLRMLKVTFFHNAHTRLPFKGVAAFYKALAEGTDVNFQRPLFLVSSSPWNLYDLLLDFFRFRKVPEASFFLRDIGLERGQFFMSSHHEHKSEHLDMIFEMYPNMKFILLGDSGQKDPEIFLDAVKRHPERVHTIYIRDVTTNRRDAEVKALLKEVLEHKCELVFVKDSLDAAKHAAEKGLIMPEHLPLIQKDMQND